MKQYFVKQTFAIAFFSAISLNLILANDPIVVTVDKYKVTQSEFQRIYNKNNPQASYALKDLKDYMDLFVNYKLKVVEAEHLGFDTMPSFISEYKTYRDQLAKPYLTDKDTEEKILHESYDRLQNDFHIKQIVFKCNELTPPKDTLVLYKKALEAYNKLLKGEVWDSIYINYSEDKRGILSKGDMGFCTVLQLVYPLESAAYNMKPGEKYKIVRTKFGYHLINLLEKRPSKGEIKVHHIYIAFPENANQAAIDSARSKMALVYSKLQAGESFDTLAKHYSDDKRSATNGGELNWFGVGMMIPDFESNAFALQNDGDYSKPFRSSFGYHLIKRITTRPISSFENVKENLKQRIENDDRAGFGKIALINKVKSEAKFTQNEKVLNRFLSFVDSTAFDGTWQPEKAKSLDKEWLFKLGTKNYLTKDFSEYIAKRRFRNPSTIEMSTKHFLKEYIDDIVIEFENNRLDSEYPDLRYLLQEYHDGILLFNLMEQKIWTQAARDSAGLEKYYAEHKDIYKWGERIEALVVSSKEKDKVDAAYKFAQDFNTGKITSDLIWKKVCNDTTEACFNCQVTFFEKQDNHILDSLGWEPGITPVVIGEGKYGFFIKKGIQPARPKTYEEAKGTVIADYQLLLEKNYIDELRKKYKVIVDEKVLESMKK